MFRYKISAPIARQPSLPDRDFITTNAWGEVYNRSLGSSLRDEEEEIIYGHAVFVSIPAHLSGDWPYLTGHFPLKQAGINTESLGILWRGCASVQFLQTRTIWIDEGFDIDSGDAPGRRPCSELFFFYFSVFLVCFA